MIIPYVYSAYRNGGEWGTITMANTKQMRAQQLATDWFAVPERPRSERRIAPVPQSPLYRGPARYRSTTVLTPLGEIASSTRFAGTERVDTERFFLFNYIGEGTEYMPAAQMQALTQGLAESWNAPAMYGQGWCLSPMMQSGIANIGRLSPLPGLDVRDWMPTFKVVNADYDTNKDPEKRLLPVDGRLPVPVGGGEPVNDAGLAALAGVSYDFMTYMAMDRELDYSQYLYNIFWGRGRPFDPSYPNAPRNPHTGNPQLVRQAYSRLGKAVVKRGRDVKRVADGITNVAIYTGDAEATPGEWEQFQHDYKVLAGFTAVYRHDQLSIADLVETTLTHSSQMEIAAAQAPAPSAAALSGQLPVDAASSMDAVAE
jgi:hypothetical protein